MIGLIGKKLGMTRTFQEDGRSIPVTVIQAGPCVITQVKDEQNAGYSAIQIGFGAKKPKNTPLPMQGHFRKAGTERPFGEIYKEFKHQAAGTYYCAGCNAELF